MLNRMILLISLVAVALLLLMVNITTPMDAGPLGVLVFFTMIYVAVFGAVVGLIAVMFKVAGKKKMAKREYVCAAVVAFGPIMLLLVQSFGALTVWTGGLILAFMTLGCFAARRRL